MRQLDRSAATLLDVDTPTDAALLARHPQCPAELRSLPAWQEILAQRIDALMKLVTTPDKELLVAGRLPGADARRGARDAGRGPRRLRRGQKRPRFSLREGQPAGLLRAHEGPLRRDALRHTGPLRTLGLASQRGR